MDIVIRPGKAADAARCAEIFYAAFKANAERHNFPNEVTPPDGETIARWSRRFSNPGYYGSSPSSTGASPAATSSTSATRLRGSAR